MALKEIMLIYLYTFLLCIFGTDTRIYNLRWGVLKSQVNSNEFRKHCIGFYSGLTEVPVEETLVKFYNTTYAISQNMCVDNLPLDFDDYVVYATLESNCSLVQQAIDIEDSGGLGSIFIADRFARNINASSNLTLNTVLLNNRSYQEILMDGSSNVGVYSSVGENEYFMYYTLVIIWMMAQFTVMVGAFWSGLVRNRLYHIEQDKMREPRPLDGSVTQNVLLHEESSLKLSPKVVIMIVMMMCIFLVGLWTLLDYLVYVIIALFCFASIGGIYSCFEPIVMKIPCGTCRTPYFNIYLVRGVLEVRQIILLLFAIAIPVVWVVFRKETYAWILQDFLGIAFCINMLVRVRLPNLMICTLLLCLLVLYDIFFVFITPFITAGGTSIMVDVAQGSSGEELPMVLKVPYFVYPEVYDVCNIRNYSLLGLGDILVPGLLISFLHSFDLRVETPCRLYYFVSVVSYGVGLILTFVFLYLMQGAQPALLYLVPAILLPAVIIAAARGELAPMWSKKFWKNKTISDAEDVDAPGEAGSHLVQETPEHQRSTPGGGTSNDGNVEGDSPPPSSTNSSTEVLSRKRVPDDHFQ